MTILEILEKPNYWNSFKAAVKELATSTNNNLNKGKTIYHKSQEEWDKMLKAYSEYLDDVENAINVMHKSEKYKPNLQAKYLKNLQMFSFQKRNEVLKDMGYKIPAEIDGLGIFNIIKNFFINMEKNVKDGDVKVNDSLHSLNQRAIKIAELQPSVNTEEVNYFPY